MVDEDKKSVPADVGEGSAGWVRVERGVRPLVRVSAPYLLMAYLEYFQCPPDKSAWSIFALGHGLHE